MPSHSHTQRKTLDPNNQFMFVCPVFNAKTKIASCFALQHLVMRGEGPETRRGCQVAHKAGKCPINVIIWDMMRKGDDPYHSLEAKVGNLRPEILERISPVLVQERDIETANLSAQEAALLRKGNENARLGVKNTVKKPRRADPTAAELDAMMPITRPAPKPPADLTIEAAKSGDMAAAINAETGAKA